MKKVITNQQTDVKYHYVIDDSDNIWTAPNHWLLLRSNQGNHIGHDRHWEVDDYHYSREALRSKFLSAREALDAADELDVETDAWDIDGYTWKIIPYYEIMDVLHRTGTKVDELWGFNIETNEHVNEFYTWLMDGGWPVTGIQLTPENVAIVLNEIEAEGPTYLEFLKAIGRPNPDQDRLIIAIYDEWDSLDSCLKYGQEFQYREVKRLISKLEDRGLPPIELGNSDDANWHVLREFLDQMEEKFNGYSF